jgi:membrane-bound lytic murein transglycosylase C
MAKSYIPAYGLMQIVPKSAGMDATKFLYGKPKLLLPSYLYKADKNIEIGTVYLRILYYNYLKGIENPSSRLYCAIAAYNTGAGNVAKAFAGNTNISEAVNIINRMTPEDVYRHLRRNLPYTETKKYIKKVIEKMSYYKSF